MNSSLEEMVAELKSFLPKSAKIKKPRKTKKPLVIKRDQDLLTKKTIVKRPLGTLYNIHKRSVPVGIDKSIVIGLTRYEADLEVIRLIRQEQIRRNGTNEEIFFYFDILPQDAKGFEKDIYYNEGSPVL